MENNNTMPSTIKSAEKHALARGLSNIAMRRTPLAKNPTGILCSDWETNNDRTIADDYKI